MKKAEKLNFFNFLRRRLCDRCSLLLRNQQTQTSHALHRVVVAAPRSPEPRPRALPPGSRGRDGCLCQRERSAGESMHALAAADCAEEALLIAPSTTKPDRGPSTSCASAAADASEAAESSPPRLVLRHRRRRRQKVRRRRH